MLCLEPDQEKRRTQLEVFHDSLDPMAGDKIKAKQFIRAANWVVASAKAPDGASSPYAHAIIKALESFTVETETQVKILYDYKIKKPTHLGNYIINSAQPTKISKEF